MVSRGTRVVTLRGDVIVLPEEIRDEFGLRDGSTLTVDTSEHGIVLRPLEKHEIEIYSPERRAEFLLNNAMNEEDYKRAVSDVRDMGLDPKTIPHQKPSE